MPSFVAISIRNSSFATDGNSCPGKRGSCREARSGRNPTGSWQPAGSCYGISEPATLPERRHRAAPTARETTPTGKVIANKNRMKTACTRPVRQGGQASVPRIRLGRRESPPTAARGAIRFRSAPLRRDAMRHRGEHRATERRGARPMLRDLRIVRRVGSSGRGHSLSWCKGCVQERSSGA